MKPLESVKFCGVVKPNFSDVNSYLTTSFNRGKLSNFGWCYEAFQSRLQYRWFNSWCRSSVIVSSAHTALMAAYSVLEIKRPIMPAYTFRSTYVAATIQGIEPLLVDVDRDTGCLTPEIIKSIDPATYDSVVVVCSLSVIPELQAINELCKELDKKLIIDAAPCFGTEGIYSYGDAVCVSFHATKSFPLGEGGVVIAHPNICKRVKEYVNFGFDNIKHITGSGINAKVSEYTCAIGLSLLDIIEEPINRRLLNAELYKTRLGNLTPKSSINNTVYQSFPVFMKTEEQANLLVDQLDKNNIESVKYYKPIVDMPNTTSLYKRNVCLPIHHQLSKNTLDTIIDIVRSVDDGSVR